mgnify:CR=1 FL=1
MIVAVNRGFKLVIIGSTNLSTPLVTGKSNIPGVITTKSVIHVSN